MERARRRRLVALLPLLLLTVAAKGQDWYASDQYDGEEGEEPAAEIFPANISGTYRGTWRKMANRHSPVLPLQLLQKEQGTIIYILKAAASATEGVLDVEGEVVLRDGVYVTEEDVQMKVGGVYVAATGRLHAVLEAMQPLHVALGADEQQRHTTSYRQALRDLARDWLLPAFWRRPGLEPAAAAAAELPLQKRCEFSLNLRARREAALAVGAAVESREATPTVGSREAAPALGASSAEGGGRPRGNGSGEGGVAESRETTASRGAAAGGGGAAPREGEGAAGGGGHVHVRHEEALEGAGRRRRLLIQGGGGGGEGGLVMNGTLVSGNCGMALEVAAASTHIEAYYAKAVNYTLMITGISFIQVLLLIKQMESTATPASVSKVSLLTVGQQAIMDAYLCLLHLTTGIMVEPLFNAFATAAFFEFVIFAIFEMRYLLSVWRARRASADPWTAQRELSLLYARFYGVLLGGILLTYQLQRYMRYLLFLLYGYWVPQIVSCVRHDARQPLQPLYVIGMTFTRLALPLYVHGCPRNVLRVLPQPALCAALVAWSAAQAAVLLAQWYLGPRCFVPRRFLPAKYDYFRAAAPDEGGGCDVETGEGSRECVICMSLVDVGGAPASRMVTPCGHFFHPLCLQRWMEVKLECPTCRRVLPPP